MGSLICPSTLKAIPPHLVTYSLKGPSKIWERESWGLKEDLLEFEKEF
jgi:hypothetical protein